MTTPQAVPADTPLAVDAARLADAPGPLSADGRVLVAWATPAQRAMFSERFAPLP